MTGYGAFQRLRAGCGVVAAFTLLGCGSFEPPVARTVDGVTSEGRYIEPDAYALYAVGALREARGQWAEALAAYRRALLFDRRAPELQTRIGAVACRLQQKPLADRAFASARQADPSYGPLWFELATCLKARGELAAAHAAALEALRLDPERYETSLLAADLAEQRGDRAQAWRLRDALVTHTPGSLPVQRAVLAAAQRANDARRAERARDALAQLTRRRTADAPGGGVARALWALGHADPARARREAELVLGADPANADALVVALCAADLEQDHAGFALLLTRVDELGRPVSPELLDALSALLARRVSAQAGQLLEQSAQ